MVETPRPPESQPPESQPPGNPAPLAATETTERSVPAHDNTATRPATRRIDAGNTALLIGIIVGLIGAVSVLVGIPVFLLNENVNRLDGTVDSLAARMSARFEAQNDNFERRFEAQDAKLEARFAQIDRRFEAQDAKLEARFAQIDRRFEAQDAKLEARFNSLDTEMEELRRGQSEIDRKLAVLIASLGRTDTATAGEG